ncbi:hypothetical protein QVD17_31392 [Tagetes erecta]|uniref:DUF4216 domain-containing protein n=1 Tax=Tagetes erecta TaxID=13708 RepID=A0AAD8NNH0_TARER|nr:hypothetical protein QVD17_31392 [Tagetes erecta]
MYNSKDLGVDFTTTKIVLEHPNPKFKKQIVDTNQWSGVIDLYGSDEDEQQKEVQDTADSGVQVDEHGFTLVDFTKEGYKWEPFILATQATQVFFVKDPWKQIFHVVLQGKRRILGVDNVDDEKEYNQFDDLPPFSIGIQPGQIMKNTRRALDKFTIDVPFLADFQLSQNQTEPVHACKPTENLPDCQPTKPVAASKTPNDETKIAELLNRASLRPASIHRLAQQVALQTKDAYSMLFTSPTGMYEEPLEETVEFEAIMRLCVNGLTDICILHWFTMYLYKVGRQTGLKNTAYFHPRYIENSLVSDDSEFVIDHIRSVISFHKDKQWFMAPHLLGKHWVLILLQHHPTYKTWKGHIFDSLKGIKDPSNYPITSTFEDAINQKITWGMVDCRQQPKDWECGYCVMMAMYDFVIHNREHMLVNKLTMVCQRQIDEFVERTLEVFISSFGVNKDQEDG